MRMPAVIVTGGAVRIGRHICLKFAGLGWPVVVHYQSKQEEALEVVDAIMSANGSATALCADLMDPVSTAELFDRSVSQYSSIGCLVNNASLFEHDTIESFNYDQFDRNMTVNLKAPLLLSKQMSRHCLHNRGYGGRASPCIVNILDQKVANTNADNLSYTISKHGLHDLTAMLSRGLAPTIRVNAVAPGPTLKHAAMDDMSFESAQRACPLGYGPSPDEIADAVAFLAEARSITGQTIYVDCGDRFVSRIRDN